MLAELAELRREIEIRALRMSRQLLAVDAQLREAGIPVLWLKGPVLSVQVWDEPGVRAFVDLDALVRREHVQRARRALAAGGFVEALPYERIPESVWLEGQHDLGFTHADTGLSLELHWRVGPRFHEDSLPAEVLFDHVEQVRLLERSVSAPTLTATALVHAVHAAGHEWDHAEHVAVMAALLQKLPAAEQERLAALAAEQGCSRRLHIAVLLSRASGRRERGAEPAPGGARGRRREGPRGHRRRPPAQHRVGERARRARLRRP